MDYSKLTLGQLLSSDDITIRRNATSILKVCQKCDHKFEYGKCIYCLATKEGNTGAFPITSVHRDDLAERGFDTDSVSNEMMERIAEYMEDCYAGSYAFWDAVDAAAESVGLVQLPIHENCPVSYACYIKHGVGTACGVKVQA